MSIRHEQEIATERGTVTLTLDRMLCNDVTFPDERHPHAMRAWVIGNEYGALCLVWASHEQEALDAACDAAMLDGLAVDEADYQQECADACARAHCTWDAHQCDTPDGVMLLGNAGEPFASEYAWCTEARLTPLQERYFAEARGANVDTLDQL